MKTPPTRISSRRGFIQIAGLGAASGASAFAGPTLAASAATAAVPKPERLPREVWIATISQNRMEADSPGQMIAAMLRRMEQALAFEPDFICLPEVFPFANLRKPAPLAAEVAERPIGEYSAPFAEFARKHACHVVCPIYTKEDGRTYNAALFLGPDGKCLGEYRKLHPTTGEIENGITPGPLDLPVFDTVHGRVGAQICFDIQWQDGWESLAAKGAEIVFWPSAFGGGAGVNGKAWQNKYCVVSSTWKGASKICDPAGEEIARTGQWDHWVCAPLNLEMVALHTWPYCLRFQEIREKYGRAVSIRNYAEEESSILESRSPEVRIADVMREFDLKSHREHILEAQRAQEPARPRA